MRMRYIIILVIAMLSFIICACKKSQLDQRALGRLDEDALANKEGVEGLLIGAYSLLDGYGQDERRVETGGWGSSASNWIYGSICGSEAYTGSKDGDQPLINNLERFAAIATNDYILQKWKALYAGIHRTNSVLRIMRKATDMTAADTVAIRAEAVFLRGYYHFEATKMWNKVPFANENITYESGNYLLPNDSLIWKAIESDFAFSAAHLPNTQLAAIGRANKYAAMAFLAKVYMFQGNYTEARTLFQNIISNGVTAGGKRYALGNYADNFNPATKNSAEAVFSTQMSVKDGALGANGSWGETLNFPYGGGPSGCCGFFQPSQWLVNHFKTDVISGLPDLISFNSTDVENDIPYAGTLDPRLDWTVGRRGIPFLDWGLGTWVRDTISGGPYNAKKNVYYKSQEGIFTDDWNSQTANNINLLRYADVLLLAAEAEAETGNFEKAREYVNRVRERAADPNGWVHTYIDPGDPMRGNTTIPAANYKVGLYPGPWDNKTFALKAIQFERVLELALEGHRFFDLVRWKMADTEINTYLQKEQVNRSHLNNVIFVKGKNEFFPIPQSEIDKSVGPDRIARLKQNPGY